jgi:hypothetical protein
MEELIARSIRAVCPGRLQKAAFFVYSHEVRELIRRLIHAIINLIARVEIRGLENLPRAGEKSGHTSGDSPRSAYEQAYSRSTALLRNNKK